MPILSAGKKAMRQNTVRRARNLTYKKQYRRLLKEARVLLGKGDTNATEKLLPDIYKALDKSAKRHILKKNTASRYKSGITKAIARARSATPS